MSVFKKGLNGEFNPNDVLTREQMASVLVHTFKWQSTGKSIVVKDMNKASERHQFNIEILAQKGITILQNGISSPHDPTLCVHLASFLYKALHLQ